MRPKIYHKAKLIRGDGAVSALCFSRPRAIDLSKASWTNRDEAVTCEKCRKLLTPNVEFRGGGAATLDESTAAVPPSSATQG